MKIFPAQARSDTVAAPLSRFRLRHAMVLIALAILIVAGVLRGWDAFVPTPNTYFITSYFFYHGDVFWLVIIAGLLLAVAFLPMEAHLLGDVLEQASRRPLTTTLGLAAFVCLCGALGARYVFDNYPLSRDEALADFDAIIFQAGLTVAPVAEEWLRFAPALVWQNFMQPVADHAAFISAYLPGNALLRALTGSLLLERNLTSPLLAAISLIATYGVGRRLWPDRRDAAVISAILVGTSSQVLVTAMTPYAMSAHLALNLVWLWLFLRNDRIGHCGAMAVGFFACGLHQLVFHPLFVAPFIFSLWRAKQQRLAYAYVASYALAGLFWVSSWKIGLALQGFAQHETLPDPSGVGGLDFFLMKLLIVFADYQGRRIPLMLMNIQRFVAWQSPLLLPLALLSWRVANGERAILRALWAGVGLTLCATFIIMPFQGHGWGYRYLHGLIGSLSLLAGYGWIAFTRNATRMELASARAALALSSVFTLVVLLPARALEAHDFAEPYLRASQALAQAATEVVIVDNTGLRYGRDLVRNDPFLRNRPILMDLDQLKDEDIADLCKRFSVSLFDASNGAAYGVPINNSAPEAARDAQAAPRRAPCAVPFEAKIPPEAPWPRM